MAPLFPLHPSKGRVPVFNSSCPWASSREDLLALYRCPFTSAVVTRTTTLNGFPDDPTKHQVAFFDSSASTINSYGYSPYPIAQYLSWIEDLVQSDSPRKQIILSITGTVEEMAHMLTLIQRFAQKHKLTMGAEFNASCPNITGHPPPAFTPLALLPYIQLLFSRSSSRLKTGIKLPPFTSDHQIIGIVRTLALVVQDPKSTKEHGMGWLSCTNTLGNGLVYRDQCDGKEEGEDAWAVPSGFGGLAGKAVHHLSLGNIRRFAQLLYSGPSIPSTTSDEVEWIPAFKTIVLIGIGGVDSPEAVERFRRAGASAVACATALGREGVKVFEKLSAGQVGAKL